MNTPNSKTQRPQPSKQKYSLYHRVAQGSGQTGNDLGDQPVQVGVGWTFNVQVPSANIVKSFVVVHDGHICVFKQRMHAQHLDCHLQIWKAHEIR